MVQPTHYSSLILLSHQLPISPSTLRVVLSEEDALIYSNSTTFNLSDKFVTPYAIAGTVFEFCRIVIQLEISFRCYE
jgi:hypothetical protein